MLLLGGLLVWQFPFWQSPHGFSELLASPAPTELPVPVQGVRPVDLRDTFGAPRGRGRRHEGIDIFAPKGTPILANTAGLVWRVGRNRLGGNVVWILGPGGQRHYFAHLDRYGPVRQGDTVRPGDVIGYVGISGNAKNTPPHLHYGIYAFAGGAINPYPLLRGSRSQLTARLPSDDAG